MISDIFLETKVVTYRYTNTANRIDKCRMSYRYLSTTYDKDD